jgi:EmrB/QacA subfamily drug resistance transporter
MPKSPPRPAAHLTADCGSSPVVAPVTTVAHPRRWAILAIVVAAQFMVLLDATIVNVAVPSIRAGLDASATDVSWVLNGYIMFFGGLLLLGGRMADLLGRRRMLLTGLLVFAVASIACGLAGSAPVLVVARAFQGAGAAILSPAALSIVVTVFADPRERRTALSVWGGTAVLGGTFGVVLGGLLVDVGGWRWAFFLNVPIAAAGVVAALALVPTLRPAPTASRRPLDLPGAITATGALLLLVYGLIGAADRGWTDPVTAGSLAGAAALFAGLFLVERRSADPLMPPRLVATTSVMLSGVGLLLTWAGQISVFFMTSVYQQEVLGYSPLQAGLGLLALGVPALFAAAVLPRLMGRWRPPRVFVLGAVLVLAGTVFLVRLPVDGSYVTDVLPGLVTMGFGLPCCFVPLLTLGVSQVRPADSGVASGLLNTMSQTGAALGVATIVTLAAHHATTLATEQVGARDALTSGLSWGFGAASGVAAANVLLSLGILASEVRRGAVR